MRDRFPLSPPNRPPTSSKVVGWAVLAASVALIAPTSAMAGGKVAWLDEVVQEVILEARSGGKALAEGEATATARAAGRLFAREADDGPRSPGPSGADDLARAAHRAESAGRGVACRPQVRPA